MAFTRQLQQGSKGEDVKEIQSLLKKMGYNIDADGIYGTITAGKVQDFQKRYSLPATGAVDNKTYTKMIEVTKPVTRPIPFQSPPTFTPTVTLTPIPDIIDERSDKVIIKNAQIYLADLGYKIIPTSVWDKQTQEAVVLFKKDHLSKKGIFGVDLLISPALTKKEYNQLKTIAYSYRERKVRGQITPLPESYQEKRTPTLTMESLPKGIQLEEAGAPSDNKMIFVILALVGGALAFGMAKKQKGK